MTTIRNSAQALILDEDRLLCIQKRDHLGNYLILPGGGQMEGEPLHDTLRRECHEEIGADVEIHELRFVREYISSNHEFAGIEPDVHEMNFVFICTLPPSTRVENGPNPDDGQLGVLWIPIEGLVQARLYPLHLARMLATGEWRDQPTYLGDIN
jgi:8-oxo-dGTP diphosphatase